MCLATFFFLFHRNNFKFLNLSLKFPAFVLQHQRTHSAPNPFIKPCPRRSLLITRFQRPLHTCSPPRGTCLRCPWPVLCVHGPALCLWGSWHPYLGFSDISTCFFNFVIISNRKVGRALWRTCVSLSPTSPSC